MPTDDIFDLAWNIAKNERFKCGKCGSDCRVEIDGEETTCWDRWHSSGQHEQDMADDEELSSSTHSERHCANCGSYEGAGLMMYEHPICDDCWHGGWAESNNAWEGGESEAEDVEKGFFGDFTRKVKQKQKEQEALNEYIVNNLIRNPDGLEAGVRQHRMALEQMNKPKPAIPESMDSVTASPPTLTEEPKISNDEIQPETVRAEIPGTGFTGGAEGAPTPPSPNNSELENDHELLRLLTSQQKYEEEQEAKLKNQEGYEEIERLLGRGEDKQASEPHQVADSWTVVKDPFANPFFNDGFASLSEEQPPEVTHDNTPIISLQPDLIKGESPEEALINAGFDARRGDDMSLLPSSAFNKDAEAPKGDTSLLPAGWDSE